MPEEKKRLEDFSKEEIEEMARKAREWALSDEGRKEMEEAMKEAEEMCKELREASKIRLESLEVEWC